MADALCGPTNALQSFQKHSQVDRTLQQDRLTGPKHLQGQGFRSFDPRAGTLDADFHAFENTQPHPFAPEQPHAPQFLHHGRQPIQPAIAAQPISWAADFQRMHISDQPLPAQQFRAEAPLIRTAPGSWQTEFSRQRQNGMSSVAQGKQIAFDEQPQLSGSAAQQYAPYSAFQQQLPMTGQYAQSQLAMSENEQMQTQNHEIVSAEAWSEAFEEALKTSFQSKSATVIDHSQILHQDGAYTNDRSQMNDNIIIQQPENTRIGSDAIEYTELKDRSEEQNAHDASALARVAGELLHNVQHETDTKFQNSQFLDLMRRIRDRQVEVRNDDFKTISGHSISATHQTQVEAEPSLATKDSLQENDAFVFPNMNIVNQPDAADVHDYSFDSEQHPPQIQTQDLHPGGRLYPGSSELPNVSMSGGIRPDSADNSYIGERTTLA